MPIMIPNPNLEIFIYELPELLNSVIARIRHCERSGRSPAQLTNLALDWLAALELAALDFVRPIFACIKPLVL